MRGGQKFFLCERCGNLAGLIHNSGEHMHCCDEEMKELVPNTSDGSDEKHQPVVEVEGNEVKVRIGNTEHPMTEDHHMDWIYLQLSEGGQRQGLEVGSAPEAHFSLSEGERPVAVFAYCNRHGLWKTEI